MIKVVHISSCDTVGGAGIAAYRLHRFLIAAGISSSMLVCSKTSNDESVRKVVPHPESSSGFEELVQRQYIDRNRTNNWNTYFVHPVRSNICAQHCHGYSAPAASF